MIASPCYPTLPAHGCSHDRHPSSGDGSRRGLGVDQTSAAPLVYRARKVRDRRYATSSSGSGRAEPMSTATPMSLKVMPTYNMVIALSTADRSRAHAFALALGLETPGDLAEDGVPEPLRVQLNERASVVYVPTGGFGWTTAGRATAEPGRRSACSTCRWAPSARSTTSSDTLRGRRPGGVRSRAEGLGLYRDVHRPRRSPVGGHRLGDLPPILTSTGPSTSCLPRTFGLFVCRPLARAVLVAGRCCCIRPAYGDERVRSGRAVPPYQPLDSVLHDCQQPVGVDVEWPFSPPADARPEG